MIFRALITAFGIMQPPKRNVPPRRAALFLFYCRPPPCQQHAVTRCFCKQTTQLRRNHRF